MDGILETNSSDRKRRDRLHNIGFLALYIRVFHLPDTHKPHIIEVLFTEPEIRTQDYRQLSAATPMVLFTHC